MFVLEAVLALVLAFAFAAVLGSLLGVRGPWAPPWAFILLTFLIIWAGGAWVGRVGPAVYGVYWLPFVAVAVLVALLFAASSDGPRSRTPEPAPNPAEEQVAERTALVGITIFFWLLVGLLLVSILSAYL